LIKYRNLESLLKIKTNTNFNNKKWIHLYRYSNW